METKTVFLIQLTSLNKHKYKHMSMLSLCVYLDLYGLDLVHFRFSEFLCLLAH